ncbi:MAG TPA: ADP-forming succinate--CoA ligase subunit beta, partial [Nitrospiria bacterium]|nr:ADP-forming succinate--CoA ligase subunit beta [Nitrospiria bacterium]
MNIHEYQAKKLFSDYSIPVPKGKPAFNADEAAKAADELPGPVFVVKAQIHAGGRGKAGGVKITKNRSEVRELAKGLIGKVLVTHQTGPEGREVKKVLVEEGSNIAKELYLSIVVDRGTGFPVVMASTEGGMDIEEVAEKHPEKIVRQVIDPATGFSSFHGRTVGYLLGLDKELVSRFVPFLQNLYRLFMEKDLSMVEINPLVVTGEKNLIALDGKVLIDDNALFRHPDLQAMRDLDEEAPLEIRASQYGLNYVKLNGKIGCMVNGAGLAMATMDVIKLAGNEPANFLDVGGGASKETVNHAFQILLADSNVKGIFVNIFGGIVRCERIAGGIIEAAKEVELKVPLVVRLDGTNAPEAREMLRNSGLKLEVAETMW